MTQLEIGSLFKVSEVELVYRSKVKPKHRIAVSNSSSAYEVFKQSWDENKIELIEQFKILLLDYRNNCLGISEISTGTMNNCPVDIKIVLATALKAKASKIIPAHNHPTGNLLPSDADIELTGRLVEAGKILDIAVVDHLIVTAQNYYSFADSGLMP